MILFREFLQWMDERSVSHDQPFLARIYKEDVGPCLNFPNKEVHYTTFYILLFMLDNIYTYSNCHYSVVTEERKEPNRN